MGGPGLVRRCPGPRPQRSAQVHTRPWPSACRRSRTAGLFAVPWGTELEGRVVGELAARPAKQAAKRGFSRPRTPFGARGLRGNPRSRETRGNFLPEEGLRGCSLPRPLLSLSTFPVSLGAPTYSSTHLKPHNRPEGRHAACAFPSREPPAPHTWRRPAAGAPVTRPSSGPGRCSLM